jgi:asparagine synthase (glutamine-hydrolysing)
MFAFGLWDMRTQELFCARDRAGVKPFYYVLDRDRFIFASEIKALLEMDIERSENHRVIYDYLSQGLLDHSDETFFRGVKQLRPAHYMRVSRKGLELQRWWDIEEQELSGLSDDEYAGRFEALFEDSVRLRLRSDVPVGTCLSGGLDSSSIVCVTNRLMSREGFSAVSIGEKQRTFSSCFDDRMYDERPFIEEVTRQTGARPYYTFPQGKDLFDQIAKVIWHQDEPFGSTSIFAQWHVMKLAAENGVKVLLDGQGADELLAGYHGYFGSYYIELARRLRLGSLVKELVDYRKLHGAYQPMIYAAAIRALLPGPLLALLRRMPGIRALARRSAMGTPWLDRDFEKAHRTESPLPAKFRSDLKNHLYSLFMYSSLPGLLHYEDRNSMAFSLEARVPFLDYRLIEYIFSLPSEQKLGSGMTKVVLRNAMKGILPETVRTRVDKMGFVTPETVWFRTILKDAVTSVIASPAFRDLGYFNVPEVRSEFERHCRGERNISFVIWRWINLLLWKDMFLRAQAN